MQCAFSDISIELIHRKKLVVVVVLGYEHFGVLHEQFTVFTSSVLLE